MSDNDKIRTFAIPAILVLAIIVFGVWFIPDEPKEPEPPKLLHIQVPHYEMPEIDVSFAFEVKANYEKAKSVLDNHDKFKEFMDSVMLPTVEMKKTSLGTYYITGYTAWELGGSTATASGATCHKAKNYNDSFYNPTTCAIDPALHDFSDLFFIEQFGCFIAEDTGSAVKGKHLDLYYGETYEDNQAALCITGYYEVFSVEFIYGEVPATNYDIQGQVADLVIGWKLSDEMKGIETTTTKGPCYVD